MILKSIVIRGDIAKPLSYKLGSVEDITRGKWEMTLSSCTFLFSRVMYNMPLEISSNYVQQAVVLENGQLQIQNAPLAIVQPGGAAKTTQVIGLKGRDYFEINAPVQEIQFFFKSVGRDLPANGDYGVTAVLLVLLRRKA